jgi:hypothetical protein
MATDDKAKQPTAEEFATLQTANGDLEQQVADLKAALDKAQAAADEATKRAEDAEAQLAAKAAAPAPERKGAITANAKNEVITPEAEA